MNNATKAAAALRLDRQKICMPAGQTEYGELFRDLSPVQTVYWCCPGDPPRLSHRADFDDAGYNSLRRSRRDIVKGRFMGGNIAYVDAADLELFACAYRRELAQMAPEEATLLDLLRREGPMTVSIMKETTGLLVKNITPLLHRLQEAFLIFEDQVDNEWDRGFYMFESEFSEVDLRRYNGVEAIAKLLPRFLYRNVTAGLENIKSFYRFSAKDIKEALELLVRNGEVAEISPNRYVLQSDKALLLSGAQQEPSVFAPHRNDFLVKSNEVMLKTRFTHPEWEALFYLLIDGEFCGAVFGRFKNGPFILEDVLVALPEKEKAERQQEIIEAIYAVNDRALSPLHRYDGREISL